MNIKEYLYCFIIVLLGFIGLVSLFLSDFYHLSNYTYLSNFFVMGFYYLLLLLCQTAHQIFQIRNLGMHEIVPLMVILNWLIFDHKTCYRHRDPSIGNLSDSLLLVYLPDLENGPFLMRKLHHFLIFS